MAVPERVNAKNSFIPVFCIAYAIWTIYVQAVTATHSSFGTLLRWLPLAVLTAIVAVVSWWRWFPSKQAKRDHADQCALVGACDVAGCVATRRVWAVPVAAAVWIGLLNVGLPYTLF